MSKSAISAIVAALLLAASPLAAAAPAHPQRSGASHGITKARALKEIRRDGYTQVQDLRKDQQGWTAKAMEGGKPVSLLVDTLGVRKG